jgi:hypothetical protein
MKFAHKNRRVSVARKPVACMTPQSHAHQPQKLTAMYDSDDEQSASPLQDYMRGIEATRKRSIKAPRKSSYGQPQITSPIPIARMPQHRPSKMGHKTQVPYATTPVGLKDGMDHVSHYLAWHRGHEDELQVDDRFDLPRRRSSLGHEPYIP